MGLTRQQLTDKINIDIRNKTLPKSIKNINHADIEEELNQRIGDGGNEEYNDLASFPLTGDVGKQYLDKTTGLSYRWSGSAYVQIGSASYTLPIATDTVLGGVKQGTNLTIAPDGTINHKRMISKSMDVWSIGGSPNPLNNNWRGNNTTLNAFNVDLGSALTSNLLTTSAAQFQRMFANNTTSNYRLSSYLINANFTPYSDWEFCFVKGNSALQPSSRVIYFVGDFNQNTIFPTGLTDILPNEVLWMTIRYKGASSVNPSSVFGIAHFNFLEQ